MKKIFFYITFLNIIIGCKEKFTASLPSPVTGYLVVEGFISSGQQPTVINLSRTTSLSDSSNNVFELNAIVTIESNNNETFPVYESGNGAYISSSLSLNNNEQYRLHIKTQDNKEYFSDFTTIQHTPAIDSLTFTRDNNGVKIYVNSHDPLNNTKYYKWDYEETWEIHSAYLSSITFVYDPVTYNAIGVGPRAPESVQALYQCWQSTISTNINLGSTEKLNSDIIHLPLLLIDPGSEKLSVLYSIKVKQYALSRDGYLFYQKIQKNTEQLGSIFDAEPSELKSNIHCVSDPAEIVVGYIDISEEQNQRIFISSADVPYWGYNAQCSEILEKNDPDSIYSSGLVPTDVVTYGPGNSIATFNVSAASCVDCTTRGTNIKPSFWP